MRSTQGAPWARVRYHSERRSQLRARAAAAISSLHSSGRGRGSQESLQQHEVRRRSPLLGAQAAGAPPGMRSPILQVRVSRAHACFLRNAERG